ncbi:MAG: hypothetical protein H6997_01515 [Moraxellaceae bacterium]|nr:hypothetical protein [Moraxellaceae bacterium]
MKNFLLTLCLLSMTMNIYADDLQERITALENELEIIKSNPSLSKIDGGLRAQTVNGTSKFRFAGRLQADYAFYDKDVADLGSGSELRTLRMGVRGKLAPQWDYKLEADFLTGNKVRITEGYLAYKGCVIPQYKLAIFLKCMV